MFGSLNSKPSVEHKQIPPGDAGIRVTCDEMRRCVAGGLRDPFMWRIFRQIQAEAGTRDPILLSKAIVAWVVARIEYRYDTHIQACEGRLVWATNGAQTSFQNCEPVEILNDPRQIVQQGFGDCDDFTILLDTLHRMAGIQTEYVVAAVDASDPAQFSHVYLAARFCNEVKCVWGPIDGIYPAAPWGWEHPRPFRKAFC